MIRNAKPHEKDALAQYIAGILGHGERTHGFTITSAAYWRGSVELKARTDNGEHIRLTVEVGR